MQKRTANKLDRILERISNLSIGGSTTFTETEVQALDANERMKILHQLRKEHLSLCVIGLGDVELTDELITDWQKITDAMTAGCIISRGMSEPDSKAGQRKSQDQFEVRVDFVRRMTQQP